MKPPSTNHKAWWGRFSIDLETGGEWRVGPSTVWIYRSEHSWRIIHRPSTDPRTADPMAKRSDVTLPVGEEEMSPILAGEDEELDTSRFSVRSTHEALALEPVLADRPVVSRPEHPIYVLPDESVTLYLSTPLWVRVKLVDSNRTLRELPSHRMSDTWFGPSTREGELCYATRTAGRLRLDRLPLRLHRALTPLRIRNTASDALPLERVQLPAPHLALYVTPSDALWTQAVTMTREPGAEGASVRIQSGPPPDAADAELIQEPRETNRRGLFTSTFSAFGSLFGP